jgi:hypothetical protein
VYDGLERVSSDTALLQIATCRCMSDAVQFGRRLTEAVVFDRIGW